MGYVTQREEEAKEVKELMATTKSPVVKHGARQGFCVFRKEEVGFVSFDGNGEHGPHEAAFLLIARADMPGEYSFPHSSGGEITVSVEYPEAPSEPISDEY